MTDNRTLQLFSDLHLEFMSPPVRDRWLDKLDPTGVDVAVLAGDICMAVQMEDVLGAFCEKFPEVVFVAGNHEYYGTYPHAVHQLLGLMEGHYKNFHWLNNRAKTVAGLRFVGGTLWFPRATDPEVRKAGHEQLMDFRKIGDFEPWVYNENTICEAVLKANLPTADVVVTHHIPTSSMISPRFRLPPEAKLNHYFCRDLTTLIEEYPPPLWVFGHTHDRMWNYIRETLLVSNPKGYPHEKESPERGKYAERRLIEISGTKRRSAILRGDEPGPGMPGSRT